MKILLPFLCLLILSSCSNEVRNDQLVSREGVIFEYGSVTPFSGTSMYYENDQLVGTMVYINGIPNGLGEQYYENGQLKSKGIYKNGKIDGLYEKYEPNGQLWFKENYKDGVHHGLTENYSEHGLMSRQNYKNGKPYGKGVLINYYPDGQLRFRKNYKDGYLYGKRDGLHEEYLPNGDLSSKVCYKDDEETDMSYCED